MLRKTLLIILTGTYLSGCSVGMALSGKPTPDLGYVSIGKSRGEIEIALGTPIKSSTLENGDRMDVYLYHVGNEPSAGRAIGHAAMDVLTFGVWEIIGTPIEGFTGTKHHAIITYDKDDIVKSVRTKKVTKAI